MALPAADITSSDFKARAYDYYAQLRAQAPVHPVKLLGQTAWLVSRYDDVATLLKDTRFAKDRHNAEGSRPLSRLPGMLGFLQAIERNMLDLDAPDHTRLRGLVHLAFTPRLVDRMRARIEGLSEELLARAMAKGTMDVIADYALPGLRPGNPLLPGCSSGAAGRPDRAAQAPRANARSAVGGARVHAALAERAEHQRAGGAAGRLVNRKDALDSLTADSTPSQAAPAWISAPEIEADCPVPLYPLFAKEGFEGVVERVAAIEMDLGIYELLLLLGSYMLLRGLQGK